MRNKVFWIQCAEMEKEHDETDYAQHYDAQQHSEELDCGEWMSTAMGCRDCLQVRNIVTVTGGMLPWRRRARQPIKPSQCFSPIKAACSPQSANTVIKLWCCWLGNRKGIWPIKYNIVPQQLPRVYFWGRPKLTCHNPWKVDRLNKNRVCMRVCVPVCVNASNMTRLYHIFGTCVMVRAVSASLHPRFGTCCHLISRTVMLVANSSSQALRLGSLCMPTHKRRLWELCLSGALQILDLIDWNINTSIRTVETEFITKKWSLKSISRTWNTSQSFQI